MSQSSSDKKLSKLISQNSKVVKTLCCIQDNTAAGGAGGAAIDYTVLLTQIRDIIDEPRFDFEILCNPNDDSLVIAKLDRESGVLVYTTDGVTPYAGPTPIICGNTPATLATITPFLNTVSVAGNTIANAAVVTILNTGVAAGTVLGQSLGPGLSATFEERFDQTTNQLRKVPAMAFDATGTSFLISTTL